MVAARTRLDIATENLANVSSDGFRRCLARGRISAHGVEITRVVSPDHGSLRHTGRPFDLAIVGDGVFRVRDAHGVVTTTRDGAFTRDRDGVLRDDAGRALVGAHGVVRVADGTAIDEHGIIVRDGTTVNRLELPPGSVVRAGYIETANVDAIGEMVGVLTAQRSFESAEKVVAAIDATHQKAANDVARVK